jgi:hypothetical protein
VYGQLQTSGNRPVNMAGKDLLCPVAADYVSQNGQIFRGFAEQRGAARR